MIMKIKLANTCIALQTVSDTLKMLMENIGVFVLMLIVIYKTKYKYHSFGI